MSTKDPLGGELEFLCPKCAAEPGEPCVRLYRSTTKVDARKTTTPLSGGRVHLARPRSAGLRRQDIKVLREVSAAWTDEPDTAQMSELELHQERARERFQERVKMTALRLNNLSNQIGAFIQMAYELELDVGPLLTERLQHFAMLLYEPGAPD